MFVCNLLGSIQDVIDFLKHLIGLPAPGPASVAIVIPTGHETPGDILPFLGHLAAGIDSDLGRTDEITPRPPVGGW